MAIWVRSPRSCWASPGKSRSNRPRSPRRASLAQLLNPLTIVGLFIYGLASFAYIVALNRIPVSIAFPSVAASYAIVAVLAHILWHEPLGWPQLGGIVLIGAGIFLLHQLA